MRILTLVESYICKIYESTTCVEKVLYLSGARITSNEAADIRLIDLEGGNLLKSGQSLSAYSMDIISRKISGFS